MAKAFTRRLSRLSELAPMALEEAGTPEAVQLINQSELKGFAKRVRCAVYEIAIEWSFGVYLFALEYFFLDFIAKLNLSSFISCICATNFHSETDPKSSLHREYNPFNWRLIGGRKLLLFKILRM